MDVGQTMLPQRHAMIIATIGRASTSPNKLRKLFLAGVGTSGRWLSVTQPWDDALLVLHFGARTVVVMPSKSRSEVRSSTGLVARPGIRVAGLQPCYSSRHVLVYPL
jgi:hypothetical protein